MHRIPADDEEEREGPPRTIAALNFIAEPHVSSFLPQIDGILKQPKH
jgi:hypothetical protein